MFTRGIIMEHEALCDRPCGEEPYGCISCTQLLYPLEPEPKILDLREDETYSSYLEPAQELRF